MFVLPVAAVSAEFSEETDMRSADTRVWQTIRHQTFRHPITGEPTSLEVDIPSRIVERGSDINFLDEEGTWQPTDTTLVASQVAGVALEAVKQRAKLRFSAIGAETFNVSYEVDGGTLRTGIRSLCLLDPRTGEQHVIATPAAVAPTAEGSRAIYAGVFPGANVVYENSNVIFKQNLVLTEAFTLPDPAAYDMNPETTMLVLITALDVSATERTMVARTREGEADMNLTLLADAGVLEFRNEAGFAVHRFETGTAWSGADSGAGVPVFKRFQWINGKLCLLEGLRCATLRTMERPITIDYVQRTGTLSHDEVWDRNTTWVLSAPLYVSGTHLVIEPGAVVKLGSSDEDNDERIQIEDGGKVTAIGEPYLPIMFTAYNDDGYGEDAGTGTPTRATYPSVFKFQYTDANQSRIQFCRFRYASAAIYFNRASLDSSSTYDVRDCIFNECDRAVVMANWSDQGVPPFPPNDGVEPSATLCNNLVYDCNKGAVLVNTTEMGSGQYSELNLLQNTFEGITDSAVMVDADYTIAIYMTATNNIMANCDMGYDDPLTKIDDVFSSLSIDFTGFAQLTDYNDDYTGNFTGGANDPDYQSTSQFNPNDLHNGEHYLKQDGEFVDCGDGVLADFGITGMTTKAPTEFDCDSQNPEGTTTMSVATADTSTIDLGYHHPRVDYIVGCDPTKGSEESTVFGSNATLTIDSGVVIALFRPNFQTANDAFFTNLLCLGDYATVGGDIDEDDPTLPFDREDMAMFDSSYYLGTKFVAMRFSDEENSYGPWVDAGSVWFGGDHPKVWAAIFRHMHVGLVFDDCYMDGDDHIKGCVFDHCDAGIFAYNLKATSSQPSTYNDLSNLHVMFDLFLDISFVAEYLDTDGMTFAYGNTFHNHTILDCPYGVWMDANANLDGNKWLVLFSDLNAVVGCGVGIGGNSSFKSSQLALFGQKWDQSGPESHDAFWNNGTTSNMDVDTNGVTVQYGSVNHQSPYLVSVSGASVKEKQWQSVHLSQKSDDASRLPVRPGAFDSYAAVDDAAGWPTLDEGDSFYRVKVFGLDDVSQWSGTLDEKVNWQLVDGEPGEEDYYVDDTLTARGNMLIQITCETAGENAASVCTLDLVFKNGSALTVYLSGAAIAAPGTNESLCVWVGMDGSTFWASATHDGFADVDDAVTQNAPYAMWYATSALMISRYNAVGMSPAVDIYETTGPGSNGYTATDQTIDNNYKPGTQHHLLDAGYHYQGWAY